MPLRGPSRARPFHVKGPFLSLNDSAVPTVQALFAQRHFAAAFQALGKLQQNPVRRAMTEGFCCRFLSCRAPAALSIAPKRNQ